MMFMLFIYIYYNVYRYAAEYGDRLLMMDKGHIVMDKAGAEKTGTDVSEILSMFNAISIECGN